MVKSMKKLTNEIMEAIEVLMNNEKREQVHNELAPCDHDDFLRRYVELDPEFENILKSEFSIDFDELQEDAEYDNFKKKVAQVAKELVGKELNFVDLDNEMMRLGFHTEFDSGLDFDEIAESGTILYTNNATDGSGLVNVEQYATIEFEVIAEHSEDENASATYIKITEIWAQ